MSEVKTPVVVNKVGPSAAEVLDAYGQCIAEFLTPEMADNVAQALNSQPDWTRIEDMPEEWKDGRELLGYREDCGQFLMKWTDADEFIPEGKEEEHGCDGEWEFECDWFIPDTGYRISNDGDPTHVRELPPPPKGKQP